MSTVRKSSTPKIYVDELVHKIVDGHDIPLDDFPHFRQLLFYIVIDNIEHIVNKTLAKLEGSYYLKKDSLEFVQYLAKCFHDTLYAETVDLNARELRESISYFIGITPLSSDNAIYGTLLKTVREVTEDALYNLEELQETFNKLFPLINGNYTFLNYKFSEFLKHDSSLNKDVANVAGIHRTHLNCYDLLYTTIYAFLHTFAHELFNATALKFYQTTDNLDVGTIA